MMMIVVTVVETETEVVDGEAGVEEAEAIVAVAAMFTISVIRTQAASSFKFPITTKLLTLPHLRRLPLPVEVRFLAFCPILV